MTELAAQVRRRAQNRCEYCLIPQAAFRRPFHIEHILAKQHGGLTQFDNLALACWQCNLKKGTNLTSIDPETGAVTRLFHPRTDEWTDLWFAKIPSASKPLTGSWMDGKNRNMPVLFLFAFRFVRLLLSGHQAIAIENAALRMQLARFSENGSARC